MECIEPQDPVSASLPDIKSILKLINEQNEYHMLIFSQEGGETTCGSCYLVTFVYLSL